MRVAAATLIAVAGCGRIGFDPLGGDTDSNGSLVCGPFGAPVRIEGLSTTDSEHNPVVRTDELELFFHANRTGGMGGDDIYHALRTSRAAPWGPATIVTEISSTSNDGGLSISADDLTVYISSERAGGPGNGDIWVATRAAVDAPFATPTLVPGISTPNSELGPHISPDGLTLVFASDRPGGLGGVDLWQVTRATTAAPFSNPQNLVMLDSAANDGRGTFTRDGLTIAISSDRPGAQLFDVYVATRSTTADAFGTPTLLPGVNDVDDDGPGSFSADSRTLYMDSARPTTLGSDDLWFATRTCQ